MRTDWPSGILDLSTDSNPSTSTVAEYGRYGFLGGHVPIVTKTFPRLD